MKARQAIYFKIVNSKYLFPTVVYRYIRDKAETMNKKNGVTRRRSKRLDSECEHNNVRVKQRNIDSCPNIDENSKQVQVNRSQVTEVWEVQGYAGSQGCRKVECVEVSRVDVTALDSV